MHLWILPSSLVVLALISILTLKSVAPTLALQQTLFFIAGAGVFWTSSKLRYQTLEQLRWPAYFTLILLLLISLFLGIINREPGRWIPLGIVNVQPSQLAIPIVTFVLAHFTQHHRLAHLRSLLQAAILVLIPAVLILLEPDLGTTLVYLASVGIIVFLSDLPWKYIWTLVGIGLITAIFAWFFILHDYQKARITSFIGGNQDTQGSGYNARQALIAVGSGQIFGRGLGQGVQSHLRFLPERHTDFIFASLAEEYGFVGASVVVALYILIVWFCVHTTLHAPSPSTAFFALVTATMTAIQTGVNIGMNIGILPITGITLPLLSYGGSSVLTLCVMYGLVFSISQQTPAKKGLHIG